MGSLVRSDNRSNTGIENGSNMPYTYFYIEFGIGSNGDEELMILTRWHKFIGWVSWTKLRSFLDTPVHIPIPKCMHRFKLIQSNEVKKTRNYFQCQKPTFVRFRTMRYSWAEYSWTKYDDGDHLAHKQANTKHVDRKPRQWNASYANAAALGQPGRHIFFRST